MKLIQSMKDIENLKRLQDVPMELIQVMEEDFLAIYESINETVDLTDFRLPYWQALILLEPGDDVLQLLLDNPIEIEYVEKEKFSGLEYYHIAKRVEYDFQMIYSLVGIHDDSTEKWLAEKSKFYE